MVVKTPQDLIAEWRDDPDGYIGPEGSEIRAVVEEMATQLEQWAECWAAQRVNLRRLLRVLRKIAVALENEFSPFAVREYSKELHEVLDALEVL